MTQAPIKNVLDRAAAGMRLGVDEAIALYQHAPLDDLCAAANAARQVQVPGTAATYQLAYRLVLHDGALPSLLDRLPTQTPIRLNLTPDPSLSLASLTAQIANLHARYPHLELALDGAGSVAQLGAQAGHSPAVVLGALAEAGIVAIGGRLAEPTDNGVRGVRAAPLDRNGFVWLRVMREAHWLGLQTTAAVLAGIDSTPHALIGWMHRLRCLHDYSLQTSGQGFTSFCGAVLPMVAIYGNDVQVPLEQGSSYGAYLRLVAVGRLFFDTLPHHQACRMPDSPIWTVGALTAGADDAGMTHGSDFPAPLTVAHGTAVDEPMLRMLIEQAGLAPLRRDSAFHPLPASTPVAALPPVPHAATPALSLQSFLN